MDVSRFLKYFAIACLSTPIVIVAGCSGYNTVSDPDTGLMWQDDKDAKKLKKSWLTKEAYDSETG